MKASKHPSLFLSVKIVQTFVCLIILILEIASYAAWSNYVDEFHSPEISRLFPKIIINKSMYFENEPLPTDPSIMYDGQVKIWYYIVLVITLFGGIIYISKYRWIWNHALRLILAELFSFALWFSAGLANLAPWYSGPGLRCNLISTNSINPGIIKLAEFAQLQCNTDVASLSLGWVNVGLFIISLLIARKRSSELNWSNVPDFQESNVNANSRGSNAFSIRRNDRPVFF